MGQCITLPSHLLEGGIRDPGRELPQNAMNVSRGCVGEALKCVGTPLGCGAAICGAGSERRASHRAQGEQYQPHDDAISKGSQMFEAGFRCEAEIEQPQLQRQRKEQQRTADAMQDGHLGWPGELVVAQVSNADVSDLRSDA